LGLQKMVGQKFFYFPSSFGAVVGFGIHDPRWIKIRIKVKHLGSETLGILFTSSAVNVLQSLKNKSTVKNHLPRKKSSRTGI
jgi:hypothetical protein